MAVLPTSISPLALVTPPTCSSLWSTDRFPGLDLYGKYKYSGSHLETFRCGYDEANKVFVEKCASGVTGSNMYYTCTYVQCLHSYHPSNPKFRCLLTLISGVRVHVCDNVVQLS